MQGEDVSESQLCVESSMWSSNIFVFAQDLGSAFRYMKSHCVVSHTVNLGRNKVQSDFPFQVTTSRVLLGSIQFRCLISRTEALLTFHLPRQLWLNMAERGDCCTTSWVECTEDITLGPTALNVSNKKICRSVVAEHHQSLVDVQQSRWWSRNQFTIWGFSTTVKAKQISFQCGGWKKQYWYVVCSIV